MKMSKSILSTSVLTTFAATALVGHATVASADPQITFQTEMQAHPAIAHAIHDLQEARVELERSPDNFGGNKDHAIHDVNVAIHTLKLAMYYRLKLDAAAIDNAP